MSGVKELVDQVMDKPEVSVMTDADRNFSNYQAPSMPDEEAEEEAPLEFHLEPPTKPKPGINFRRFKKNE